MFGIQLARSSNWTPVNPSTTLSLFIDTGDEKAVVRKAKRITQHQQELLLGKSHEKLKVAKVIVKNGA
jgi:hypothetical protein